MKRLLCLWRGHQPAIIRPHYEWADTCGCCLQRLSYDDMVRIPWREHIRDRWRSLTAWFRRCPECGLRWGRHDANQEHIPF